MPKVIAFPLSSHCWCTTFIPRLFATQIFLCLWPVMSIRVKSTLLPYKSWNRLQYIINSCNPDLLFKRAPFPVSGLQSFQLLYRINYLSAERNSTQGKWGWSYKNPCLTDKLSR